MIDATACSLRRRVTPAPAIAQLLRPQIEEARRHDHQNNPAGRRRIEGEPADGVRHREQVGAVHLYDRAGHSLPVRARHNGSGDDAGGLRPRIAGSHACREPDAPADRA